MSAIRSQTITAAIQRIRDQLAEARQQRSDEEVRHFAAMRRIQLRELTLMRRLESAGDLHLVCGDDAGTDRLLAEIEKSDPDCASQIETRVCDYDAERWDGMS